jgi:hypothetical protein
MVMILTLRLAGMSFGRSAARGSPGVSGVAIVTRTAGAVLAPAEPMV